MICVFLRKIALSRHYANICCHYQSCLSKKACQMNMRFSSVFTPKKSHQIIIFYMLFCYNHPPKKLPSSTPKIVPMEKRVRTCFFLITTFPYLFPIFASLLVFVSIVSSILVTESKNSAVLLQQIYLSRFIYDARRAEKYFFFFYKIS